MQTFRAYFCLNLRFETPSLLGPFAWSGISRFLCREAVHSKASRYEILVFLGQDLHAGCLKYRVYRCMMDSDVARRFLRLVGFTGAGERLGFRGLRRFDG